MGEGKFSRGNLFKWEPYSIIRCVSVFTVKSWYDNILDVGGASKSALALCKNESSPNKAAGKLAEASVSGSENSCFGSSGKIRNSSRCRNCPVLPYQSKYQWVKCFIFGVIHVSLKIDASLSKQLRSLVREKQASGANHASIYTNDTNF